MEIAPLLGIRPGLTALIGGGGKTTLMMTLARELSARGTVIVCTSTKILRPQDLPVFEEPTREQLALALAENRTVAVGRSFPGGKLTEPSLPFETLAELADFVLVEADGAKCLPVKAHAPWEPVIPACADRTVLVVGADCFGLPIQEICHRPELFAALAEAELSAPVTPERLARVIRKEGYGNIIYVNKTETEARLASARSLAALVKLPVIAGSLHEKHYVNLGVDEPCSY